MSEQVWWYATRAAGLMTWSTAIASVIVGLLLSTRAIKSRTGPWMLDLHRFLGGISVLFLVVHVVTLYLDSFVEFGPRELFIPGESTWNTEAAAWGIIAMYALILVELTSLLRKWISASVWRTFHMLSIVTAAAGTYHAFLGGTDVDNPLTWIIAGAGSAIVVALVAVRLRSSDEPSSPRVAKANDREALLQEMRDRLDALPVPENTAQPELTTDGGALPRRAPVGVGAPAEMEAAPAPMATPMTEGLPGSPEALLDGGLPSSPADPFGGQPTAPAPAPEAFPPPAAADPFGAPPADPFGAPPPSPADPFASAAPAAPPADPFGAPPADPFGAPAPLPKRGDDDFSTAARPSDDPFGRGHAEPPAPDPAPADPFGQPTGTPFDPAPAAETPVAPTPAPFFESERPDPALPGDTPFPAAPTPPAPEPYAFDPASPFGSERPATDAVQAAPVEPPMDPLTTPVTSSPDADLFAPATAAEEAAAAREEEAFPELNEPTISAFQPTETAEPPVGGAIASRPAPPPLPTEAIDPATGEPDQAAYSAWLIEWLAYAEKYGEEAPEDPSRI